MNKILLLLLTVSTYALASGHGEHEGGTDIVQRTVNFALFAGLVWYLVAEPVKNYFTGRSQGIANELQKVQDKLKETANLKKEATSKVLKADKFAEELLVVSKKENKILNDNIMAQCDSDLNVLSRQLEVQMEFEQRKMIRKVVETTVNEILSDTSATLDKKSMAQVILKKVA